jgi:hypothetical protein
MMSTNCDWSTLSMSFPKLHSNDIGLRSVALSTSFFLGIGNKSVSFHLEGKKPASRHSRNSSLSKSKASFGSSAIIRFETSSIPPALRSLTPAIAVRKLVFSVARSKAGCEHHPFLRRPCSRSRLSLLRMRSLVVWQCLRGERVPILPHSSLKH